MSGGFRDEDEDDFSDLLSRNTTTSQSSYYSPPTVPTSSLDDDISTNPFADMESSRYEPTSPSSGQSPFSNHHTELPSISTTATTTTTTGESVKREEQQQQQQLEESESNRYVREGAPEPESPLIYSTNTATYSPSLDETLPPPLSPSFITPLSPFEQTPFGSPPPASHSLPVSILDDTPLVGPFPSHNYDNTKKKLDMSALLGEEKPILPSFNRTSLHHKSSTSSSTSSGGGNSLLLPISSIGNKNVGNALATLLGLESTEPEPEKEEEDVKPIIPVEEKNVKREEVALEAEVAPLPPSNISSISNLVIPTQALSIGLPPSPTSLENETGLEEAVSTLSVSSSTIATAATSSSSSTSTIVEKVSLFNSNQTPSTTPNKGFRTYNSSTPPPPPPALLSSTANDHTRESTMSDDLDVDSASMKGNYSDSLKGLRTGASSPTGTNGTRDGEETTSMRRSDSVDSSYLPTPPSKNSSLPNSSSPDLPSLPTLPSNSPSPSPVPIQSPPLAPIPSPSTYFQTSTQFQPRRTSSMKTNIVEGGSITATAAGGGGSVGPSFIISVGDPQKVGSLIGGEHTVYTVKTKTTSSAFRKPEFAVLRRFSHFLWLFDALTLSNPGVIVPGMPEKSALGRFGSDFVENRRSALQVALMKIVAHPMLVGDPDLRLFLESDSFSIDIKQRRLDSPSSESATSSTKSFLTSIVSSSLLPTSLLSSSSSTSSPKITLSSDPDPYFTTRLESLSLLSSSLSSLLLSLTQSNKMRSTFLSSLNELELALKGLENCDLSTGVKKALHSGAGLMKRVQTLGEEQGKSEEGIGGVISTVEGYVRLCSSVRLVFGARVKAYHTWQSAESALRKTRLAHEKSKKSRSEVLGGSLMDVSDAERRELDTRRDFEDVSKLTRAEMIRFDKEKVDDFKKAIEDYIEGMVMRQKEVVSLWTNYTELLTRLVSENNPPPPPVAVVGGL